MTKKKVWRYCCDFCGKKGLSSGHMQAHEKSCTANPNRKCRMHDHYPDSVQEPVEVLINALRMDLVVAPEIVNGLPVHKLWNLRSVSGTCPMCMLAAIRQSGIKKWHETENPSPPSLDFDFKKELTAAWAVINEDEGAYAQY